MLILDDKLTEQDIIKTVATLKLDLMAIFREMEREIVKELERSVKAGDSPDETINRISKLFAGEDYLGGKDAKTKTR